MTNSSPTPGRNIAGAALVCSSKVATLSHRNFARRIGILACALLALLMPGMTMQPAFAQETCVGNSYVPASSIPGGTIAVTDSAMMYSYSTCPTSKPRLGKSIRLRAGQSVFFWFRVQGDQAYLSTNQSRYPFVLNFYLNNGSVFVSQGLISMGGLDRAAMAAEAQGAGGVFDWRLGAEKWKFDIPGTYKLVLSQQGNDIGCVGSSMFSPCNPVIEVVP